MENTGSYFIKGVNKFCFFLVANHRMANLLKRTGNEMIWASFKPFKNKTFIKCDQKSFFRTRIV
jgi:hypothetical protein